jgi:hypothetical protein
MSPHSASLPEGNCVVSSIADSNCFGDSSSVPCGVLSKRKRTEVHRVSMTNEEVVDAANYAFSRMHGGEESCSQWGSNTGASPQESDCVPSINVEPTDTSTIPIPHSAPNRNSSRIVGKGPRFHLRKRKKPPSISDESNSSSLLAGSYNSAFLSGLFADVAKASEPSSSPVCANQVVSRTRPTVPRSMSRCAKSFKSFHPFDIFSDQPCSSSPSPTQEDLLETLPDFPFLPTSVSESSCSSGNLTPSVSAAALKTGNTTEVADGDKNVGAYGWFVEMDESRSNEEQSIALHVISAPASECYSPVAVTNLAFRAPTSPKRPTEQEAEVEFALAADTVDDVLGDFF